MTKSQKYYKEHRAEVLAQKHEYYIAHRARIRAYRQTPDAKERHRVESAKRRRVYSQRVRESNKRYVRKLREQFIKEYGGKCACCGESTHEFLQLDHINFDGKQHRSSMGKGMILLDIRRQGWPKDKYRLLCANCNSVLRYPEVICPHKRTMAGRD